MDKKDAELRANPGYALGQLARALQTSESHDDPAVRARAHKKVEAWNRVFAGMLSGALTVGARTPLANTPAWVTLEVATGGFATGALLAGGALRTHEQDRLAQLGHSDRQPESARGALNAACLSDAGLAELQELLRSGRYRVEVPEEGALLVAAWLLSRGYGDEARSLLEEVGPYLGRLRFYPVPAERAHEPSAVVHVQTIKEVAHELENIQDNERALVQREVLQVWNPLLDGLVALFVETVEDGWPCQSYRDDWRIRAQQWLADYARLRARHRPSRRLEHPGESGARLRGYLARCVADPRSLSGRDIGAIRQILANIAAARGLPGSARCQALREFQAWHAQVPTRRERALRLRERLRDYPQDEGLPAIEPVLSALREPEAPRPAANKARKLPAGLSARLWRCLDAPVEVLVAKGTISSGEMLARVIPQLSAQVGAAGIADAELRRLYTAIYQAFRRRRSLLLLNLESQVKLHELPWVAAITRFRVEDAGTRASARRTLFELVRLALTAFPHVILPNKLLQEIRALCDRADVKVPIVEEIAADIFMGEFTEKYLEAARWASERLHGSLYERYYDVPYERVMALQLSPPERKKPRRAHQMPELCRQMAGEPVLGTRSVARNGRILEQAQILTTHNLVPLIDALELHASLLPELPELARRCFLFICREQQRTFSDWRLRLHMMKNTAYAWRQMIVYLSLLPQPVVAEFLDWATGQLAAQPKIFCDRFEPTLAGLAAAAAGQSPGSARFLGWAKQAEAPK